MNQTTEHKALPDDMVERACEAMFPTWRSPDDFERMRAALTAALAGGAEPVAWIPAAMVDPKRAQDFFTASRFKVAQDSVPVFTRAASCVAPEAVRGLVAKWRQEADVNDMNALEADSIGLYDAAKNHDKRAKLLRENAAELERALAAAPEWRDAQEAGQ